MIKSNKRKPAGNFKDAIGAPKKFKKNEFQNAGKPNKQANTKLNMFSGTTALNTLSKQKPVSVKQPSANNKKELSVVEKQPAPLKNSKPNKTSKTDNGETQQKGNLSARSLNRHKRRRESCKSRRMQVRQKLAILKDKAAKGDKDALKELQDKVTRIESLTTVGKSTSRLRRTLKNFINKITGKTKQPQSVNKNENNQITKQGKQQNKKAAVQQNVVEKKQKQTQIKKSAKSVDVEEDSDENEDEEDSDEDDSDVNGEDEEASDEVEGETDEEEDTGEEEEASDEEESEDDDEQEEESADEEENSEAEIEIPAIKNTKNQQQQKLPAKSEGGKSRYVVFVGNLPYTATKEDLKEHFKKVGEIVDIRIPQKKGTNNPQGFAYVEVKNEEAYQKALSLNHTFISGRRINVLYTQGGKKKNEKQKGEIKAKNFKLKSMQNQGMLAGSVKADQKRSVRRAKNKQRNQNS